MANISGRFIFPYLFRRTICLYLLYCYVNFICDAFETKKNKTDFMTTIKKMLCFIFLAFLPCNLKIKSAISTETVKISKYLQRKCFSSFVKFSNGVNFKYAVAGKNQSAYSFATDITQ
jgi:hypothetical protein